MKMKSRNAGISTVEVLVIIGIAALLVVVLLPAMARAFKSSERVGCAKNLKEWGRILLQYAEESGTSKLPPVEFEPSDDPKDLRIAPAPRISELYPKYFSDPSILACPQDKEVPLTRFKDDSGAWRLDDAKYRMRAGESYQYLGWALDQCGDNDPVMDVSQLIQMVKLAGFEAPESLTTGTVEAPTQAIRMLFYIMQKGMAAMTAKSSLSDVAKEVLDDDIPVGKTEEGKGLGNGGSESVMRLRPNLRPFVKDAGGDPEAEGIQAENVFVMFDRLASTPEKFVHKPGGVNVLYLDGHVGFVKFPEAPPATERAASLLGLVGR